MREKIIITLLAVALFFIDINLIGFIYLAFGFGYFVYAIQKKWYNELALAFPLFGYSFFLFVNKLTGLPNLAMLLGVVIAFLAFRVVTEFNSFTKLNTKKITIIVLYAVFFLLILGSIFATYDATYQNFKIQLFFLWTGVLFFSINTFDNRINDFNFEEFLKIAFILFVPHFSNAMSEEQTLSPFRTWEVFSVLDDGIRGHNFDIITATRIAGVGILAYFIFLLDFSKQKLYLVGLLVFFGIMVIICQTRQSIVALMLPMFLYVVYSVMKNRKNYSGIFIGLIFLVYGFYNYLSYLDSNGVESRIVSTVDGTSTEGSGREKIWGKAFEYISLDKPSTGFGNFKIFTRAHDYAHNIFIEVYVEAGIFAFFVLCIIIYYMFYELFKVFFVYKENSRLEIFLILATFYYLGLAQFSVDLSRNLLFFFTFALFIFVKKNNLNLKLNE